MDDKKVSGLAILKIVHMYYLPKNGLRVALQAANEVTWLKLSASLSVKLINTKLTCITSSSSSTGFTSIQLQVRKLFGVTNFLRQRSETPFAQLRS
ncbi:MAG: hypothetical protein REH78_00080, partial [Cellulomonas sp.]|nr:hypothetical protein [Cellulomonas sp.]